jgi:CubicO group peptidase (beta-lactamase class C family)
MDALLGELVASDRFSGAVMLVRNGQVVYQAVHGEANKDFSAPNTIDTKFNLGSMNKMFTAVAVAQLVERGVLSYDDPLSKFLPDFPDAESAKKIQIKHLLSHTAGLGSYFNQRFMESSRASFRSVSELMTLAEGETLQFEPGTQWSYSNTGFLVLGRVIEVVTGQDYHDFIRENVTGPAGMSSTDAYELDHVNANLAVGYDLQDGPDGQPEWRNNIFQHVIKGGPAGGGYSTVGDLVRFAQALRDGTLVSPATLHLLTTAKPEIASTQYGYGFGVSEDGSVGHSGGFTGINSGLVFWPEGEWTIAVMSNYSGGAQPVVARARRLIAS